MGGGARSHLPFFLRAYYPPDALEVGTFYGEFRFASLMGLCTWNGVEFFLSSSIHFMEGKANQIHRRGSFGSGFLGTLGEH